MSLRGRLKIRVGGSLGKAGDKLKRGAGKALASPLGRIAAGVLFGPGGAAIAGLAGDALDTSDGKFDPWKAGRRAAFDYASGKAVQKLGGVFRHGASSAAAEGGLQSVTDGPSPATWQSALNEAKAVPLGGTADYSSVVPSADAVRRLATSSATNPSRFRQIAGQAGRAGGFLSRHKNDILDYGQAAESVAANRRAARLQDEALADYRRRAPLRDRAQALLLDESRPDLTGLTADPNTRYRRVSAGGY